MNKPDQFVSNKGFDKRELKQRVRDALVYFRSQYGDRPWISDALREVATEVDEHAQVYDQERLSGRQ